MLKVREYPVERIVRSDTWKRYQSDHFKIARTDKSVPEHVLYLAECWPDFSSEKILVMLKIQRMDESIPMSAVTDVIGNKLGYEDKSEYRRQEEIERLEERQQRKLVVKGRSGVVGVWRTQRGYWESDYVVFGKKKTFMSPIKRLVCDWYDSMETQHVPERFRVLNNYKGEKDGEQA